MTDDFPKSFAWAMSKMAFYAGIANIVVATIYMAFTFLTGRSTTDLTTMEILWGMTSLALIGVVLSIIGYKGSRMIETVDASKSASEPKEMEEY